MATPRFFLAVLAAALCVPLPAARADLTMVATTTLHNRRMEAQSRKSSPEEKNLGTALDTMAIRVRGTRARLDFGFYSLLYDGSASQSFMVNHVTQTYTLFPSKQVAKMLNEAGGNAQSELSAKIRQHHLRLKETGQSRRIDGHPAREFILPALVKTKGARPNHVWISPDRPAVSAPLEQSLERAWIESPFPDDPGTLVLWTGSSFDKDDGAIPFSVSFHFSTAPIPDAVFAVPAGYKLAAPPVSPH